MNSKTNLYFNIALSVAIIFLFILHFSSNNTDEIVKDDKPEKENFSELPIPNKVISNSNLKIAFVNSDTVAANYLFSKQLNADFMAKQSSAENKLRKVAEKLQVDAERFQQGAPIMGREELERTQAELMQRQEELQMMEYELSQNLAIQEQKETKEYVEKTDVYMQTIGKELGYDYVLSYRVGGPMLFANPELDITPQVIELLNKEYSK